MWLDKKAYLCRLANWLSERYTRVFLSDFKKYFYSISLTTEMINKVLLTLKIKWSWSSTVDPGKKGLPVAISKNIHPTPLKRRQREIVNWVSIIIRDCFGWLCFLTGLENSRHLLNQSDTKLKNKRGMVIRVFPRFKQLAFFHFEFSLANDNVNLYYDWSLWI